MSDTFTYKIWHRITKGHWFKPHYDGGWDRWARLPTVDGCERCMPAKPTQQELDDFELPSMGIVYRNNR